MRAMMAENAVQQQVFEPRPEAFRHRHVTDCRQPLQVGGKDDDEQDAEPEIGHRQAEKGDKGDRVVPGGVAPCRGNQAGRHGDHQRQHERQQRQRQRARQRLGDQLRHRHAAAVDGRAEITLEHVAEPDEVLHPHRLVEAEMTAQVLDRLGTAGIEQHGADGIARHDPQHEEHQRRDRPHDDQRTDETSQQVARHGLAVAPGSVMATNRVCRRVRSPAHPRVRPPGLS